MADTEIGGVRPDWVSSTLYPFRSRWFQAPRGLIHYVDEGAGRPVVFVHGNPTWSFEHRGPIAALRDSYRCIALDHLGFGLSGHSDNPADYHPAAHGENFGALMGHLGLDDATLVFSDWGGPIALDWARKHPQRVAGICILNSWCWPVDDDRHFRRFSAMMSSRVGQLLIKRFNFFVAQMIPQAVGNRAVLTREAMAHYARAQPSPQARAASAALPGYILGATGWLGEIWKDREAFADKPALAIWGLKDMAFRRRELETWQAALRRCAVHELPGCGHFLSEEAPDTVAARLRDFLGQGVGGA